MRPSLFYPQPTRNQNEIAGRRVRLGRTFDGRGYRDDIPSPLGNLVQDDVESARAVQGSDLLDFKRMVEPFVLPDLYEKIVSFGSHAGIAAEILLREEIPIRHEKDTAIREDLPDIAKRLCPLGDTSEVMERGDQEDEVESFSKILHSPHVSDPEIISGIGLAGFSDHSG